MAKVLKTKEGVKLYPVCGFQRSQHKLFYWHNKAWLKVYDNENPTDQDFDNLDFWDEVMNWSSCVYDGLIYMPWWLYTRVKEAIVAYDIKH